MLYKLGTKGDGTFNDLSPMEFHDFADLGKREKELEDLIARNLFDVLFEDGRLMPIFQERPLQGEADIYALDKMGNLTIFELKRGRASGDAVLQALRYTQDAGSWTYTKLQNMHKKYTESNNLDEDHKEHFDLEVPLAPENFNRRQHSVIISSAADQSLVNHIDYWKRQGVSIGFLPYRVYEIGGKSYFEFFSTPYDRHINPRDTKGVMFDTNRSWDEDSIWYMMENRRVAAFGSRKGAVDHLARGDIVFFSHKWVGIIAAGRVQSERKADGEETWYLDVDFLTPPPRRDDETLKALPFWEVRQITGKEFYWGRIDKRPYLSRGEAENLLTHLERALG